MSTFSSFDIDADGLSPMGFRIRRANPTMSGFAPAVDRVAKARIDELAAALAKKVIPAGEDGDTKVAQWIELPLKPRRATRTGSWAGESLMSTLRAQGEGAGERSFREYIDADGDGSLSRMRYRFDLTLKERYSELDLNTRALLDAKPVRDLLVLRAVKTHGIVSQAGLLTFVFEHEKGVRQLIDYVAVSAARVYVEDGGIDVPKIGEDDSEAVSALLAAKLTLSEEGLRPRVVAAMTDFNETAKFDEIIKLGTADPDKIPAPIRARLVQYLKEPSAKVTETNAPFLVPMYLAKAATATTLSSGTSSDDPFAVSFFVEDSASLQVSTAAVKCAAQLYYVMVLGEELGVFDAVRFFTHRYLFREGFAVEDPQLRRDLENYVFSEQFPGVDRQTGEDRIMRCTRDGERRSFYRQVFDQGSEPVPGDGIPNSEFARLWKILMLESARYLERAQSSPHPDNYVSRQNVMQAVEDLQYNLSITCVGMSTVMTPLMYAELDFVVNRILGHEEVRKHLVPSGGSWWKVVEKLQAGQGRRARASVLHNKARLGYSLVRSIAEYTPSRFEEDGPFAEFISNVDAFITTQSIVQEETQSWAGDDEDTDEGSYDGGYGNGRESGDGGGGGYGGSMPGMPDLSNLPGMPDIPGVSAPWPGSGGTGGPGGPTSGVSNGSGHHPNGSGGVPSSAGGGSGDEWDF